jgi:hypothetical protein
MTPLTCHKCGRFVGPDGFADVAYDDYNGGYEVGYPLCARCLQKKKDEGEAKTKGEEPAQ